MGEGMQETLARFRVERAARLLRETQQPCISIALESGFCDQSHMDRTIRRVLGRSPIEVREDRNGFRQNGNLMSTCQSLHDTRDGTGDGMAAAIKMERVMGIEPTLAAWEAAVLPLNYTRAGGPILAQNG